MKPTDEEIYEQMDEASTNRGNYFGMSYEDGVIAALEWAVGDTDVKPMDE